MLQSKAGQEPAVQNPQQNLNTSTVKQLVLKQGWSVYTMKMLYLSVNVTAAFLLTLKA